MYDEQKSSSLYEPFTNDESKKVSPKMTSIGLLLFTIVLESVGTICLKKATEDVRIACVAYASYFAALSLFSIVLKDISLTIAYTTWCTIGTISVCVLSSVVYKEDISIQKWFCIIATIPFVIGMYILP